MTTQVIHPALLAMAPGSYLSAYCTELYITAFYTVTSKSIHTSCLAFYTVISKSIHTNCLAFYTVTSKSIHTSRLAFYTVISKSIHTSLVSLVLGDIEKLRCRYNMRKLSRYNDIHDISYMVLFRKQTILFVYIHHPS